MCACAAVDIPHVPMRVERRLLVAKRRARVARHGKAALTLHGKRVRIGNDATMDSRAAGDAAVRLRDANPAAGRSGNDRCVARPRGAESLRPRTVLLRKLPARIPAGVLPIQVRMLTRRPQCTVAQREVAARRLAKCARHAKSPA
jgi:hypothetical protein